MSRAKKFKLVVIFRAVFTTWIVVKIICCIGIIGGVDTGAPMRNLLYLIPLCLSLVENIFIENYVEAFVEREKKYFRHLRVLKEKQLAEQKRIAEQQKLNKYYDLSVFCKAHLD